MTTNLAYGRFVPAVRSSTRNADTMGHLPWFRPVQSYPVLCKVCAALQPYPVLLKFARLVQPYPVLRKVWAASLTLSRAPLSLVGLFKVIQCSAKFDQPLQSYSVLHEVLLASLTSSNAPLLIWSAYSSGVIYLFIWRDIRRTEENFTSYNAGQHYGGRKSSIAQGKPQTFRGLMQLSRGGRES